MTLLVPNLNSIRNLTIKSPSNDKLRFPTQTAHFLQLRDLGHRNGPEGLQLFVAFLRCAFARNLCIQREGYAGDGGFGGDVCMATLAVVATFEFNRASQIIRS